MTSVQYPNSGTTSAPVTGPNLGWAFDTMGRLNTMTDLAAQSSIIGGATYGPANQLLTVSGGGFGGAASESRTYNAMLQLTQLTVSNTSGNLVNMTYTYSGSQNNGKIVSQADAISGETVQYTYDSLSRLATAQATTSAWGQSYAYDGFGNLTDQNVIAGSAPEYHATFDPSTNHPSGVGTVDANGNSLVYEGGGTVSYDGLNRLAGVTGMYQYSYAPGNKRVWRGLWTSGTLTTDEVTFWSVSGQKLATYQMNVTQNVNPPVMYASQTGTDYYFGGKLIKNAGGYVGADRLGSIGHFYPYGQEKPSATQNDTEKFTGYFRDAETGLDYADQRYHNPGTGRFLTDDPYQNSAGPSDPGSWNRYAYVGGDPANRMDRTGLDWCVADDFSVDGCYLDIEAGGGWIQGPDPNLGIELGETIDPVAIWQGILGQDGIGVQSGSSPGTASFSMSAYDFTDFFGLTPAGAGAGGGTIVLGGETIGITISGGTVILVGAVAAVAYDIYQALQMSRARIWNVRCNYHIIGGPNHESNAQWRTTVTAATYEDAYTLGSNACNTWGWQNLGLTGWHLQHIEVSPALGR